jgi:hypothetical protein
LVLGRCDVIILKPSLEIKISFMILKNNDGQFIFCTFPIRLVFVWVIFWCSVHNKVKNSLVTGFKIKINDTCMLSSEDPFETQFNPYGFCGKMGSGVWRFQQLSVLWPESSLILNLYVEFGHVRRKVFILVFIVTRPNVLYGTFWIRNITA